jgi:ComF family protein
MVPLASAISRGIAAIAFPRVCVCCGRENTRQERQLCSFCLENRFQDANPENERASSDTLLPDGIAFQHALWQFDKGGDLQHLLHKLKYQRLTTIGVDLGRKLGERLQNHPQLCYALEEYNAITVPVPLHYRKYGYRGFNQAFKIARGFEQVWNNIPICKIDDVIRTKNTRTQTGFSLEKRLANIDGAFKVNNESVICDKTVVIIDDVFTTGATTFELARTLQQAGAKMIIILTVAQS